MKKIIVAVSLLGWLAVANAAEDKKLVVIGEDPGPVYTQIVTQWVQATNFAKNASDLAVAKLKLDMEKDPKLKKVLTPALIADLEQFFYELFASRETTTELAKLYAQYFTLDEMNELVKFYKTPLGVKLIKSNSELTIKSQQIGANLFKKHENDYIKVLAKYLAPEAAKAKPAATEPKAAVEPNATTEPKTAAEPKATTEPKTAAEPKPALPEKKP